MVRILRVGSLRTDSTVARVVVLPLPVGPVTTIIPCGSVSRPRSFVSSAGEKPSLSIASKPVSLGSKRMTANSPYCVGMMATRRSSSDLDTCARAAPSCGRRRSAMLRPARILTREIMACGKAFAGTGTLRSSPSTRMRTTKPVLNGSM